MLAAYTAKQCIYCDSNLFPCWMRAPNGLKAHEHFGVGKIRYPRPERQMLHISDTPKPSDSRKASPNTQPMACSQPAG